MKPKKNHVYCQSCHKSKIQFDTKKKADSFIKYNADEIYETSGHAPVRSYYCVTCCCWHVTSNASQEVCERLDRRDRKSLKTIIDLESAEQLMQDYLTKIRQLVKPIEKDIKNNKIDDAWEKMHEMRRYRNAMRRLSVNLLSTKATRKLNEATEVYDSTNIYLKQETVLAKFSYEELQEIIKRPHKNKYEQHIATLAENSAKRLELEMAKEKAKLVIENNPLFHKHLNLGQIEDAEKMQNHALSVLRLLIKVGYKQSGIDKVKAMCENNAKWLAAAMAAKQGDEAALLQCGLSANDVQKAQKWIEDYVTLSELNDRIAGLGSIKDSKEFTEAVEQCRSIIKELQHSSGNTNRFKEFNIKLNKLQKERKDAITAAEAEQRKMQKTILLEIIGKIETMESAYSCGDVSACKQRYGECKNLFTKLNSHDDDAHIVEMYIESWHERLKAV